MSLRDRWSRSWQSVRRRHGTFASLQKSVSKRYGQIATTCSASLAMTRRQLRFSHFLFPKHNERPPTFVGGLSVGVTSLPGGRLRPPPVAEAREQKGVAATLHFWSVIHTRTKMLSCNRTARCCLRRKSIPVECFRQAQYLDVSRMKKPPTFVGGQMLALPIFPGRPSVVFAVKSFRWNDLGEKKTPYRSKRFQCWRYLSSRAVTRQVLSAQMSLTSVFGMGTGGPSPQSTPTKWIHPEN